MRTQNKSTDHNPTRFDLEEALIGTFNIVDDLKLIVEEVLEGNVGPDELANMLTGIQSVHDLRCQKAFAIFSQLIETKVIK